MIETIKWYVMRIRPVARLEFQVMQAINQREFQTLVPFQEEWIKRRKRRYLVKSPWFPSYVFVGLNHPDEGQWLKESINKLADDMGKPRPIIGLVGYSKDRPARLTDDNLVTLKKLSEEGPPKVDFRTVSEFAPGKLIKVTEGPFRGFGGVVDSVTRDKVRTMISIFGRMTPVEFEYDGVKAGGVKAA